MRKLLSRCWLVQGALEVGEYHVWWTGVQRWWMHMAGAAHETDCDHEAAAADGQLPASTRFCLDGGEIT